MQYKQLGTQAGISVYRLCLGTMNFGEGKKGLHRYWSNDLKQSRKIIKKAVELQMLTEQYNLTAFVSMQNHYNLL